MRGDVLGAVERRRRRTDAEKFAVVCEVGRHGASVIRSGRTSSRRVRAASGCSRACSAARTVSRAVGIFSHKCPHLVDRCSCLSYFHKCSHLVEIRDGFREYDPSFISP